MGDVSATEGALILLIFPSLHSKIPTNPQIGSEMPLIFDTAPRRLSGASPPLSARAQVLEFHAGLRAERSSFAPKLRGAPVLAVLASSRGCSAAGAKFCAKLPALPRELAKLERATRGGEGGKEDCCEAPRCRAEFDGR